ADVIAGDLIAQAEHDPGSCFLLTTSKPLAERVKGELEAQTSVLDRSPAIVNALRDRSGIIVDPSMDRLIDLANQFAAEHVSLNVKDPDAVLQELLHGRALL